MRRRTWLLLLLALGLRLLTLGWDAGVASSSLHPDERQVAFTIERLDGWFDNPDFFAYGSLHFQVIRAVSAVAPLGEGLRSVVLTGRVLSLAASMLALILGWVVARRAWGSRTADLFLAIAAWVPLDLQQSHYATVEAHHTAWIMLALAASYWLAVTGRSTAAAAAGAAVGASLAVKVASLALGLPLGLALLVASRGRGVLYLVRLASLASAAGVIVFWVCQPWAFAGGRPPLTLMVSSVAAAALFHVASQHNRGARNAILVVAVAAALVALSQGMAIKGVGGYSAAGRLIESTLVGAGTNPDYARGVGEQIRMVLGHEDLPYVRVFVNTLPVLYPLRELALWGWGPFLLLAAIAAAAGGCRAFGRRWWRLLSGRWDRSSILLLILLAWLVPMALRLSTLYVKYLRYWEPLMVPAALIAAWWLARLPRRLRRRILPTVVAGTVVWGLAYLWAFVDPHPHRTATRWLSPMLQAGQVVAFENWDETLGLHLDDGPLELFSLPSYDLPDNEQKVQRWCRDLDRADWVVFTSNRVVRTILANPKRFERTRRLYQLLLSGEAGFEVMTRSARGPRLFGLRWPVQLADESFVNYDFPQVVILRRTGEVNPEQLAERVTRPLSGTGRMGLAGLEELLEPVPIVPPVPSAGRQVVDLALWTFIFCLTAASMWILLLPLLGHWPDAGLGLAVATGWVLPAWLLWFGNELDLWRIGADTASWILLAMVTAAAVTASRRWPAVVEAFRSRRSGMLRVAVVAIAVGLFFVVVRAYNPAIYWGEKPMDFAFLNAFLRADQWPTGEPWMAGMPLHYYYFGQVLAAFPILLTGCTGGVGFNLMAATVPALGAAVLAVIGMVLASRRSWLASTVLPALVLLTGNLAWPWLLHHASEGKWFDLWWATSRVIPGFAIDEYPLWTALFADLHGHFIALPLLIATLAWGWVCVAEDNSRWPLAAAFCGLFAAALVATNPWDLFILVGALGAGTLTAARHKISALARLAVAGGFSVLAAAPFVIELLAGLNAGAGRRGLFLTEADFAPAWAVLRHFGLFLIPLAVLAVATLGRRSWLALPLGSLGVLAGLSFNSSAAALALAGGALFAVVIFTSGDRLNRLGWALASFGSLGIAACERFTLIDRMNTLFKVYNGVWLLLAVALAALIFRTRGRRRLLLFVTWLPLQAVALVNVPLGVAQGWMQPRISSPRPSLDGQAYLAGADRETWFLVRALQGMARPGDVVAESAGPYYSQHTRIVMHTGQPTVVGWEWHLSQRGQSVQEIKARFADLETLYSSRDARLRRQVLDRYSVGWAVLGKLERRTYQLDPAASLRSIPGVVEIAARGEASIHRVLPAAGTARPPLEPTAKAPPGVSFVGSLPDSNLPAVRSLHRDEWGALAVMPDGRLLELDGRAAITGQIPESGCEVASAVRWQRDIWALCTNSNLLRFHGERWRPVRALRGAQHLMADASLWAWGRGGLWQVDGDSAKRVANGPVAAAAANRQWVAWSDGTSTWIGRGSGRRQRVEPALDEVKALAWLGRSVWALDSTGLHRSGGGLMPWSGWWPEAGPISGLAGGDKSLWLIGAGGLVMETAGEVCPPPWEAETHQSGLREPRGLAVSTDGWFVVADTLNHRVRWYSFGGACLDEFGSQGAIAGTFREPTGLALADDGSLAITDTWNGRIQILRRDGSLEIVGKDLFGPRGVLWTGDGSLLVADTGNRCLLRFGPPGWDARIVADLQAPVVGLAWVGGLVAAATPADRAVILLDPSDGRVVRRIEIPGWSSGEQQEGYLAVLPSGDLAASAPLSGEIWAIDPTGQAAPRLLRSGLPGVTAIAMRPDSTILASLTWQHRLVRVPLEE